MKDAAKPTRRRRLTSPSDDPAFRADAMVVAVFVVLFLAVCVLCIARLIVSFFT